MAIAPTINDIREITPHLDQKLNLDIYNYTLSFLRRRFAHVFNVLNIKNVSSFIQGIKDESLIEDFCYNFPVPDTEMFRDPAFWRVLKSKVLNSSDNKEISIWLPELSSTEELFSLLVMLNESGCLDKSKIYCNVSCEKQEHNIKARVCDSKHLEISKQNFKRLEIQRQFEDYFTYDSRSIILKESFAKNINLIRGNLLSLGPIDQIDFCLYRNRMIYFNSKLQFKAENEILKYLSKGSLLAIGINERVSTSNNEKFEIFDVNEQIYKVV